MKVLESLIFTYTAKGKRQIQVKNIMDEKLREITNLGVEIMNSKRQVVRKLGHVVQFRVCRKRDAEPFYCLCSANGKNFAWLRWPHKMAVPRSVGHVL